MRRRILIVISLLILILFILALVLQLNKKKNEDEIILYGNVDVREVDIGFRVLGRVQELRFEEGDLVPAGTLMAALDKQPYLDQVAEAKANVASFQASLNNAQRLLERRKELVGDGGVSLEDLENAESSRDVFTANVAQAESSLGIAVTNLKDTEVFAPTDGIILTRIKEPGSVVNVADPVYTLSILTPVWVRAYVTEPELGLIYPGMPADVYTDTEGSKVYHGHIGFISPVAEFTPKTVETTSLRTDLVYRIRVIADNPDRGLRQGMPVTVKIPLNHSQRNQSE